MRTIRTTAKGFRAGLAIAEDATEIRWESTGYLSVRLFDARGQVPLRGLRCTVEIPGEGSVELIADDTGLAFHPDVPFLDYELELQDGGRVQVPAVANRDDVHERHVVARALGFVNLHVRDSDGFALEGGVATLTGAGASLELRLDADGRGAHDAPLPPGEYHLTWRRGELALVGKVVLTDRPGILQVASLRREEP
ncbi:MAG: hypothetical protein R3B48_30655 [Kofleriaceae bacterium]